jgi:acyl-CoA thioester hydrolase
MARHRTLIPLRWSDMDALGHVNNVQFLRLLEEARVQAIFEDPDTPNDELMRSPRVVAHQEIDYLAMLSYRPRPVPVDIWIGSIGGASYEMCYEVLDDEGPNAASPITYARAVTTIVHIDPATGRPTRLTDEQREQLEAWSDEPGVMRSQAS